MGCKEETRIINKRSYYCRQWDAEKALLMKFKLAKVFGPAFTGIAVAITKDSTSSASDIFTMLFSGGNSPETILALMKEVVESVTCDSERITTANFNELFSNELLDFYKVFFFILEVNYKSLLVGKLPGLDGKLEEIKKVLAKAS